MVVMKRAFLGTLAVSLLTAAAFVAPASADRFERQVLIDRAGYIMERFANNRAMFWFRSNVRKAYGVMIVPRLKKGGFIVGGSGGSGVLLALDQQTGEWSPPAFYTIGSLTVGLQAGGEVSEIVLLVMTKRGLDSLLGSTATLGGDISVAAGPIGLGAKGSTADIVAFSRTRGFYGGINIEGAAIVTRDSWNHDYYGGRVTASDILIRRTVHNPKAEGLRQIVAKVAGTGGGDRPATPRPLAQGRPDAPPPLASRQGYTPPQGSNDLPPPPQVRDDSVTSEPLPWKKP